MLAGCAEQAVEEPPAEVRARRTGALHHLVLVPRTARLGGPFFLDRFETTRLDWYRGDVALRAPLAGPPPPPPSGRTAVLPAAEMTLAAARRHAHWRLCRLPRVDELLHVATGGGQYNYPWGDLPRDSWGNTGVLGYGAPTPVGTFESGRQRGGAYDLRGNVAEWTEAPSPTHAARLTWYPVPAVLASQWPAGVPLPLTWQLEGASRAVPRLALGENLHGSIERDLLAIGHQLLVDLRGPRRGPVRSQTWRDKLLDDTTAGTRYLIELPAGGRWSRVGLRLATDPRTFLARLLREPQELPPEQLLDVQRFLGRHVALFVAAWPAARDDVDAPGPLLGWLRAELGT